MFKPSVCIRLHFLCLFVFLLKSVLQQLTAALLSSADLLMTDAWSSPMLETWPTLPKSSEVGTNVTVQANPPKQRQPHGFETVKYCADALHLVLSYANFRVSRR